MSNKLPYIAVPITKLCQQNQRDHYQFNCIDRSTCFPDHKYGGSSTDFSICVACCSFSAVRVDLPSRHPLLERSLDTLGGVYSADMPAFVALTFSFTWWIRFLHGGFLWRLSHRSEGEFRFFYDGDVVSLHTVLSSSYSTFTYFLFSVKMYKSVG